MKIMKGSTERKCRDSPSDFGSLKRECVQREIHATIDFLSALQGARDEVQSRPRGFELRIRKFSRVASGFLCRKRSFGYLQDHVELSLTCELALFFCKVLEELKAGAAFRGWSSMVHSSDSSDCCEDYSQFNWLTWLFNHGSLSWLFNLQDGLGSSALVPRWADVCASLGSDRRGTVTCTRPDVVANLSICSELDSIVGTKNCDPHSGYSGEV